MPERWHGWRAPITVFAGVALLVAAEIWVVALTPPKFPSITVSPPSSLWGILFWVAVLVGTIRGVRIAWGFLCFYSGVVWAFLLGGSVTDPGAQTIGGLVLVTLGLVFLYLVPMSREYEQRRIRLVIE